MNGPCSEAGGRVPLATVIHDARSGGQEANIAFQMIPFVLRKYDRRAFDKPQMAQSARLLLCRGP